MTNQTNCHYLDTGDAEQLEKRFESLLTRYQNQRSPSLAQTLVSCLEALIAHPQLSGGDERRCQYCRLVRRWRYLAGTA
jgi:hypothetical protein